MLDDYKYYLVTHIIVSLLFLVIRIRQKDKAVSEFLIVLFLPGAGLLLIILGDLLFSIRFRKEDFNEAQTEQDDLLIVDGEIPDANILPYREVLLLDDSRTKRILLTDILKRNSLKVAGHLAEALKDRDSEVSHYAATAIMSKRMFYEAELRQIEEQLKEQPDNTEVHEHLLDKIREYLDSKLLDYYIELRYRERYSQLLQQIIESGRARKDHYIEIVNLEVSRQNYKRAQEYSRYLHELYPQDEDALLTVIRLYYALGDYVSIQQHIKEMKELKMMFSPKGLEIVRYWS